MSSLLEVSHLSKSYKVKGHWYHKKEHNVLKDISFNINEKKTLAIIGETGSGKSTLAKLLVGAEQQTRGEIKLNGQLLQSGSFKQRCKHIRMIFQDSGTTLNPSITIERLLDEPLKLNTNLKEQERKQYISATLQKVGLLGEHMNFYPHMFSGGQKQSNYFTTSSDHT